MLGTTKDFVINYVVYVAGEYCPVQEVVAQGGINAFSEAQFVLFPNSNLINFGDNDRVPVQVFFLDAFSDRTPEYRLLFDGEIVNYAYNRSPNSIGVTLSAVSPFEILAQMYKSFFSSIIDKEKSQQSNLSDIRRELGIEALLGANMLSNISDIDLKTETPFSTLFTLSHYKERLTKVTGDNTYMNRPFVLLRNIIYDILNLSSTTELQSDVTLFVKSLITKRGLFTSMFASPIYEDSSKLPNTILAAIRDATTINTVCQGISAMMQQISQQNTISYWEIIQKIYAILMQEILMPVCPPHVYADVWGVPFNPDSNNPAKYSGILGMLSKPTILYGVPFISNTIMPCMIHNVSYTNNHFTRPTRFYLANPDLLQRIEGLGNSAVNDHLIQQLRLNHTSAVWPASLLGSGGALVSRGSPLANEVRYKKEDFEGGVFAWPVENNYRVTSSFGMRDLNKTGQNELHPAIDIPSAAGTPVYSMTDGKVLEILNQVNTIGSEDDMGWYVKVEVTGSTNPGYTVVYHHLDDPSLVGIKVGQEVKVGGLIGRMGLALGRSTGPHVHIKITSRDGSTQVDPIGFLQSGLPADRNVPITAAATSATAGLEPHIISKNLIWNSVPGNRENEFFKGPIILQSTSTPDWVEYAIKQFPKRSEQTTKQVGSKEDIKSVNTMLKGLNDILSNFAHNEFEKEVSTRKVLTVDMKFNPFVVPGFPSAVIDSIPYGSYYLAMPVQVIHRLSTNAASTTVTFQNVTTFTEAYVTNKGKYDIGPSNPNPDVSAIFNSNAQSTEYYRKLFFQNFPTNKELIFNPSRFFYLDENYKIITSQTADSSIPGVKESAKEMVYDYHQALKLVARPIASMYDYLTYTRSRLIYMDEDGSPAYLDADLGGIKSLRGRNYFNGLPLTYQPANAATSQTTTSGVALRGVPVYYDRILSYRPMQLGDPKPTSVSTYPDFIDDWPTKIREYRKDILNFLQSIG
jgi:murein DD-endopeptidase MepM/ murein hydrolase activator NlpD